MQFNLKQPSKEALCLTITALYNYEEPYIIIISSDEKLSLSQSSHQKLQATSHFPNRQLLNDRPE